SGKGAPADRTRSPAGDAEKGIRRRTSTNHERKRHRPQYCSTAVTLANGNPHLMRTLPRNGSAKHGAGAQVRSISGVLLWLLLCLGALPCPAADPQSYKVDMASTGDSDMNATLKATSDLITLRTSAPVGPFGLIGRARSDLGRLKTVLES